MYTCITDFLCCTEETTIVKKIYFNKNKLKILTRPSSGKDAKKLDRSCIAGG